MGIDGFKNKFLKEFGGTVRDFVVIKGKFRQTNISHPKVIMNPFDHIYVDLNSVIHNAVHKVSKKRKGDGRSNELVNKVEKLDESGTIHTNNSSQQQENDDEIQPNDDQTRDQENGDESQPNDDVVNDEETDDKPNDEDQSTNPQAPPEKTLNLKEILSRVNFSPMDPEIENQLVSHVLSEIKSIYRNFLPRKGYYLLMDGPAPLAKAKEQRDRRLDAIRRNKIATCCISPGSKLMVRIEQELLNWAKTGNLSVPVVISGSNVPGEGEHKLMNLIHHSEDQTNENHLILSNDSDLYPLVFFCQKSNLYICSCAQTFRSGRVQIFSKPMFMINHVPDDSSHRITLDLGLLALLAGNDYLPSCFGKGISRSKTDFAALVHKYLQNGKFVLKFQNGSIQLNLESLVELFFDKIEVQANKSCKKAGEAYIRALLWNCQYAATGICPNYELECPKTIKSTSLADLVVYNKKKGKSNIYGVKRKWIEHPLNGTVFSLCILPKECFVYFDMENPIDLWDDPMHFPSFDEVKEKTSALIKGHDKSYRILKTGKVVEEFDFTPFTTSTYDKAIPSHCRVIGPNPKYSKTSLKKPMEDFGTTDKEKFRKVSFTERKEKKKKSGRVKEISEDITSEEEAIVEKKKKVVSLIHDLKNPVNVHVKVDKEAKKPEEVKLNNIVRSSFSQMLRKGFK